MTRRRFGLNGTLLLVAICGLFLARSSTTVVDAFSSRLTCRTGTTPTATPTAEASLSGRKKASYGTQLDSARNSYDGVDTSVQKSRRRLFSQIPLIVVAASSTMTGSAAQATMENKQSVFKVGVALTKDEARARFREGRKSIQYLLDHYDEICEVGGDNVRRYLGTVGTSSGMFGISKVMKTLMEDADDIVEYTETMAEVEKCVQQADGSAYMAIFVATSTSYTPPAKYFGEAKIEVKRCIKAMDELASLINLEL